jgi:hypothetical protein
VNNQALRHILDINTDPGDISINLDRSGLSPWSGHVEVIKSSSISASDMQRETKTDLKLVDLDTSMAMRL